MRARHSGVQSNRPSLPALQAVAPAPHHQSKTSPLYNELWLERGRYEPPPPEWGCSSRCCASPLKRLVLEQIAPGVAGPPKSRETAPPSKWQPGKLRERGCLQSRENQT